MKSKSSSEARSQRLKSTQGEGPNWVFIVGGALLSTLSIRLGCKLKQAIDSKQQDNTILKGSERSAGRRLGNCRSSSSLHLFGLDENNCFNCASGSSIRSLLTLVGA
ncbi:Microsomal triglyceride transfer protein large subunit [Bienertia sinuspersici]